MPKAKLIMKNNLNIVTLSILFTFIFSSILLCQTNNLLTGAERTTDYLPLLKGKNIGLVVNQTSMIGSIHLVDSLINLGLNVKKYLHRNMVLEEVLTPVKKFQIAKILKQVCQSLVFMAQKKHLIRLIWKVLTY